MKEQKTHFLLYYYDTKAKFCTISLYFINNLYFNEISLKNIFSLIFFLYICLEKYNSHR